jgi:hypothetical protein
MHVSNNDSSSVVGMGPLALSGPGGLTVLEVVMAGGGWESRPTDVVTMWLY